MMAVRPSRVAASPIFRSKRLVGCATVLCVLFLYVARPWVEERAHFTGQKLHWWARPPPPPSQQQAGPPQGQTQEASSHTWYSHNGRPSSEPPLVTVPWHWEDYPTFEGFYNGIKTLVDINYWLPEQSRPSDDLADDVSNHTVPFHPSRANPYDHIGALVPCYLDEEKNITVPDIFSVQGALPASQPAPSFGDYAELGMRPDQCWERFGRLGPYGYSYGEEDGGFGLADMPDEDEELDKLVRKIDYRGIEWGKLQEKCFEKNLGRDNGLESYDAGVDHTDASAPAGASLSSLWSTQDLKSKTTTTTTGTTRQPPRIRPRNAFVLRAWTGLEWTQMRILNVRALVTELSLQTGGSYTVHILLHVKDSTLDITNKRISSRILRENVPAEFRSITTLWSVPLMEKYYAGFTSDMDLANPSNKPIYDVYRSPHFVLQWFAQWHPEYAYFWNWELDIRFTGHYFEFFDSSARWADRQPRKYLWERNARFWIPELHGSYEDFRDMVGNETEAEEKANTKMGSSPWGPHPPTNADFEFANKAIPSQVRPPVPSPEMDAYAWGVDEPADLISLTPLFDPATHAWVLRHDMTGYGHSTSAAYLPPRRVSIITVGRFSARLLHAMHDEVSLAHRSMFPEMFPPSIALHYGLKAVFIPHPVYFEQKWPLETLDEVFNFQPGEGEGDNSVYCRPGGDGHGTAEENFFPASYYFNARFGPGLWRRWLGQEEDGKGGEEEEREKGRMCLRGVLIHPIKYDFSTDNAIAGT